MPDVDLYASCGDMREAGRGFASRFYVVCQEPAGHGGEHFDPDALLRWTDDKEA